MLRPDHVLRLKVIKGVKTHSAAGTCCTSYINGSGCWILAERVVAALQKWTHAGL